MNIIKMLDSVGVVADGQNLGVRAGKGFKVANTKVLGDQAVAEPNAGAVTAYTAHVAGVTAVTSNAATDLDTTAAALHTLVGQVTALTATVNSLMAKLRTHGIIAT